MSVPEVVALLSSANTHLGEYIAGMQQAREQLDQCIGVATSAAQSTLAARDTAESQTLIDSSARAHEAEAKVREMGHMIEQGLDAAYAAIELNESYIGRLLS